MVSCRCINFNCNCLPSRPQCRARSAHEAGDIVTTSFRVLSFGCCQIIASRRSCSESCSSSKTVFRRGDAPQASQAVGETRRHNLGWRCNSSRRRGSGGNSIRRTRNSIVLIRRLLCFPTPSSQRDGDERPSWHAFRSERRGSWAPLAISHVVFSRASLIQSAASRSCARCCGCRVVVSQE